jgi:hypothetical protein
MVAESPAERQSASTIDKKRLCAKPPQTQPFVSPNGFLLAKPMMHFRSGWLMQFCSGGDTGPKKESSLW